MRARVREREREQERMREVYVRRNVLKMCWLFLRGDLAIALDVVEQFDETDEEAYEAGAI